MNTPELLVKDRPWSKYPVGTKAHSFNGGAWLRTSSGWQWAGGTKHPGDTFPTPGADAFGRCVELPKPSIFYIMIDHDSTADCADTLDLARAKGQKLCDAEVIPCTFSIYKEDEFVEDIKRSDGRGLDAQIAGFNAVFGKK